MQVYSNSIVCLWEKGLSEDLNSLDCGRDDTREKSSKNESDPTIFIHNCHNIYVGGYVEKLTTDVTTVNSYHAKSVTTECGNISSRDQYQQQFRLGSLNTPFSANEITSVHVSNDNNIIRIENSNQVEINLAKVLILNVSGPGQVSVLNCGVIHTSIGNVNIGTGRVDVECESKSGSIEITQCGSVKTESGNITIGRHCKSAKSRRGRISIPRALKAAAYSISGKVIYRDEMYYDDI